MGGERKSKPMFIGYGWYKNEGDYRRLLSVADDAANLHDSFSGWLQAAQKGFEVEQRRGLRTPVKIEIDIGELIAFCSLRGGKVNGPNRTAFINQKVIDFVRDKGLVENL